MALSRGMQFAKSLGLQVALVIRDSKDRNGKLVKAEDRLQKLLRGPEFQHLHKQMDSILARIQVVSADLATPGFGLSEVERKQLCRSALCLTHQL